MDDDQARADTGQSAQHTVPPVRQISVAELKTLIESESSYELVDVRTDAERTIATVEGFRLLDQSYHDHLVQCDPETRSFFNVITGSGVSRLRSIFGSRAFVISPMCRVGSMRGRNWLIQRCRGTREC